MRFAASVLHVSLAVILLGCTPQEVPLLDSKEAEEETLNFGVCWPPQDPEDPGGPAGEPLLQGTLRICQADLSQGRVDLRASIELARQEDEKHREIWNERLAYREYNSWMRRLRVWDAEEKWLWPNLPYLLRIRGKERIERYGGVDPSKGVDNDFAAVLIRAYDGAGKVESTATKEAPLVSAEWHPLGVEDVDRRTVVHAARSEEFTLPVEGGAQEGRFGVWLIYADFMGSPTPNTWPKKREWDGGILAYFEIDWRVGSGGAWQLSMAQKTPPSDTGFDWGTWVGPRDGSERERAVSRLRVHSETGSGTSIK